ncbi:MAG: threonine synthase [Gemmatimonadaceae bacterium]
MTQIRPSILRCEGCGREHAELAAQSECDCGGLLALVHALPDCDASTLRARFAARRGSAASEEGSGVWRYRELIMPNAESVVSYPEGNTPLLAAARVSAWCGTPRLQLKHEGYNPTGSFKDRGMTVAVTQARRIGAKSVACASTGNTSASLAAYAALAGLRAVVLMPEGHVALGKLAQTIAHGARTIAVRGDFDACLGLLREAQRALQLYVVNSINPWRLEGQKAIVFEALEQRGWDAPDWIVLPAGNLGNTAAFGRALSELHALGLITKVPRLAAIQAQGAAPFAHSFSTGFAKRVRVQPSTVASAIRIGNPASFTRAVQAIRATDGVVIAVPDEEILEAKAIVDASGIGCEPASAASVAGTRRLVRDGTIRSDDQIVAVLTGHLLKDPDAILAYHTGDATGSPNANPPITIEPSLKALERAALGPNHPA